MSEEKKYLDGEGVKYLWNKAKNLFVKKEQGKGLSSNDYTSEEKDKLAELENYELPAASEEALGGIKIGEGLHIDENGVVKTVYNPEMPVEWDDIQDVPTTLEGYGITDAVSDDELSAAVETIGDNLSALDDKIEEVREEVKKVYKYKGTVDTFADLENIDKKNNGDIYDVLEDGMNYAWNADENRWDNLGAIFEVGSITNEELDIITGSASSESVLKELLAEGGDITLTANITLSQPVAITNDTVLDLDGYTMSYNEPGYALVANGAALTLKNGQFTAVKRLAQAENGGEIIVESGNYNSADVAFSALGEGSKVTFNGGNLTAREGGIGAFDKGSIEINGGRIAGIDNFPVFTNGTAGRGGNTIVFNDGQLVGNITSAGYESCGVYVANNDTFIMNGGSIISNDGCGILMRAGNVTINGGTIEAKKASENSHTPGYVGDNKTQMSASAVIYHESANYPGKAGMSLTITGGNFIGADHALEILSNEAEPAVTVTGGSFSPDFPE